MGEINRGWDVAKYLLGHEREMISGSGGAMDMLSVGGTYSKVIGKNAAGELDDPILRAEMAELDVDVFAYRAMGERFMDQWKTGTGHPASLEHDEVCRHRTEQAPARDGDGGQRDRRRWSGSLTRAATGAKARTWLRTKANSIEGGTSEIMLNVIAKRILELPGG